MPRRLHRVKIREKVGPYKWALKSRFYWANSAGEAARKYKGTGEIIRAEKVPRGFGGFFTQGEKLLQEFAEADRKEKEAKSSQSISLSQTSPVSDRGKKYYNRQRKGAFTP